MKKKHHCIKPLTDEEIRSLVKSEADAMDFETSFNYLNDMVKADTEDMRGQTHIDRIIWLVRHAHLNGFSRGIEIFNDVAKKMWGGVNGRGSNIKLSLPFLHYQLEWRNAYVR